MRITDKRLFMLINILLFERDNKYLNDFLNKIYKDKDLLESWDDVIELINNVNFYYYKIEREINLSIKDSL